MKKIFLGLCSVVLMSVLILPSCRKKYNDVSVEVTVSYPIIKLLNGQYYSINVGGVLPATNVIASAYDTFYKQNCPVVVDFTQTDNLLPGIYPIYVSAKNQYGFVSYDTVWLGVTNISDSLNLSGTWINNVTPSEYTIVNKVANGMFTMTNLFGVDVVASPSLLQPSFFLVTSTTAAVFPSTAPSLYSNSATLNLAPYDTTLVYQTTYTGAVTTVNYLK